MSRPVPMRQGGFLLAKVHQLAGRVFARMLKEAGIEELNPAQGRIMFALWQGDGIPISELAARTQLEKSTLTSMLDRLEASGFVARVADAQDRRRILILRTDKDRAWQPRYEAVSRRMNECFYRGFDEAEIAALERGLSRLLDNLRDAG